MWRCILCLVIMLLIISQALVHPLLPYMGEDKEYLVLYAKEYLKTHPDIQFFLFGHRHIELDLMLSHQSRILIVGDWISQFTYAVFNGENMLLENFEENEARS